MRKLQTNGGVAAVLDDAASLHPQANAPRRPEAVRPRRELVDDYADDADTEAFLRASGRNRRLRRGLIPRTRRGWIVFGVVSTASLLALCAGAVVTVRYATTSDKFRVASSQEIELDGNSHLSRAQMLSVFGEDVDRNIFRIPMADRRAQLEQMPWVEHATVMRLLPNRMRVSVTERVPVAFVREGGNIGLVDAHGVLLDIPPDAPGNPQYSFPVITGIRAADDAAARADRMRLYSAFLRDLDSDGKGTSALLSEIDLSDPEDVKALIPDHGAEVLVHFGQEHFLDRYHKFQEHITEWRTQYPRLSSVDMRYERQVVLQMPPKDSTVAEAAAAPAPVSLASASATAKPVTSAPAKAAAPVKAQAVIRPAPDKPAPKETAAADVPKVAGAAPVKITPAVAPPPQPVAAAAPHAAAAKNVRPGGKAEAKDAATRKRVEAIKAWMARREKLRKAAGSAAN